jgi:glucose-1-phosphate cytidylyltransferase
MKVVLFCGGLGMRLREHAESIPKPMIHIGYRPILWHVMKYYAHFGHRDFILCLGHRADVVKSYFLNYDEAISNDFVLTAGGRDRRLLASDIDDWRITFVDTGCNSNLGQRLKAVEHHLAGDEMFLANYSDGLTDLPLPQAIEQFARSGKTACFAAVQPTHSFHVVTLEDDETVADIQHLVRSGLWINGGYFIFRKRIFDYIRNGEELVEEPFQRLIRERELIAYRHKGFWLPMDTFKDKQLLEDMYARGEAPWELWKQRDGTTGW